MDAKDSKDISVLKTPPPRTLEQVRPFFGKNRTYSRVLIVVSVVVFGIALLRVYFREGMVIWPYGLLMALGLALIPLYFAWANHFIARNLEALLIESVHTSGTVTKSDLTASTLILRVEYKDQGGLLWLGRSAIMGAMKEDRLSVGDSVDVLYIPETPKKFALLTPAGVAPGRAKQASTTV